MSTSKKATSSPKASYQELQAELDQIMQRLQSSDLAIDEAVTSYERGMKILAELETYLNQADNQVTKINQSFER